ncbi:hypothetical protein FRC12_005770 [Ceratobasidium sp. 428]|nr:hypothetical protein FRC12_005770 [Ceratobasidium sp. 428]
MPVVTYPIAAASQPIPCRSNTASRRERTVTERRAYTNAARFNQTRGRMSNVAQADQPPAPETHVERKQSSVVTLPVRVDSRS